MKLDKSRTFIQQRVNFEQKYCILYKFTFKKVYNDQLTYWPIRA